MEVLPRLALDAVGSDARVLWLMVMGVVMMCIGGSYLVRTGWETLPRERARTMVRTAVGLENQTEQSNVVEVEAKTTRHV